MTKIYSAKEISDISTTPKAVDELLSEITTAAKADAEKGLNTHVHSVNALDARLNPAIRKLENLGYIVEFVDYGRLGGAEISISW